MNWQALLQEAPDFAKGSRLLQGRNIGHQLPITRDIFANRCARIGHSGMLEQGRLDCFQFDSKTADLYLSVISAHAFYLSLTAITTPLTLFLQPHPFLPIKPLRHPAS